MSEQHFKDFDERFRDVVARMRLTRVLTVLGWTALALTIVLITLAGIDYALETNWTFRAATFGIASLASVCVAASLVLQALQRWNRRVTAAQVERRFGDLGQSVRTTVQYHDDDGAKKGALPSLLNALNKDVYERTQELRLTEAVSTGPLKISVALFSVLAISVLAACVTSWDWRMAVSRTLLADAPYTTIKVEQGNTRVDEKATFTLNTDIAGRTDRNVRLLTRDVEGESTVWATRSLTTKDEVASKTRLISYQVDIPKVTKPFEYQVIAGKYASPVHQVDVCYPLAINAFNIELTPPAYTGIGTKIIDKGSFETVEGSQVKMGIQLDHSPVKAWLELRPIVTQLGEEPQSETVPLAIDGAQLTADLDPKGDRFYQVFAEASDGTKLRPNRFRIRVREDRPPKLLFHKPDQLIEVHPLAELLMKLRVADDYGLRRAGIILQLNNDPEIILEDIAYDDIETSHGKLTPQTNAMIESQLPLEYFEMTVKDSISYYAFAEDNRPGQANFNETDLQFIDVRPFRRDYPVPEEGQGLRGVGNNNNPNARNLPELNEMIGRERFVLNRTMQMKRQNDRGRPIDANAIDNLINVQNETSEFAGLMGDEATFIEQQFGVPEEGRISDLLYQAQKSMLASVDSLSTTEFDVAKLQEKDALQYLIDARQRLDDPSADNANNGGGAAFRAAFRRLLRRMRRPRNDQERAREIVRRLKRAAAEQEFLMEKMSDLIPPEMPETNQTEPKVLADERLEQDSDAEVLENKEKQSLAELRRELEQEQADLGEDVHDIIDLIEELAQVSDLAQQRTMRAADNVGGVIGALERGDTQLAIENADAASSAFRVLAENIAGITANEATKRIEIARDLGLLLTDDIRELRGGILTAEQAMEQSDLSPSEAADHEVNLASPLSRRAQEQAEVSKTIEDVLNSILDPELGIQDPEDRLVKRLRDIMAENKLAENVGRMQQLPTVIDSLDWTNADVQASDLADRFDIVSQRLDAMHREILSPRIEQLRKLEKRAVETKQALTGLQTDDQVSRWHLRADGLLEDIESAQVAEQEVQSMREMMEGAGWGTGGNEDWNWEMNASRTALEPPEEYDGSLATVIGEIQRHIRELSMVHMDITNAGAVPPKYKHFVERYFDLMSGASPDPDADDLEESGSERPAP